MSSSIEVVGLTKRFGALTVFAAVMMLLAAQNSNLVRSHNPCGPE